MMKRGPSLVYCDIDINVFLCSSDEREAVYMRVCVCSQSIADSFITGRLIHSSALTCVL